MSKREILPYLSDITSASTQSSSGSSSNECFVAGTLIISKEGFKNIEDIEVGDYVLSEDPVTGEQDYKKVVQTFVNETKTIIEIEIGGELIETTGEHPFWIEGRGWVVAKYLKQRDCVRLASGENAFIDIVNVVELDESVNVYNFEVEGFHTYYVTNQSILVHNACKRDIKQINDVANQVGVDRKELGAYIHYMKEIDNMNPNDNYSYKRLVEIAKELLD